MRRSKHSFPVTKTHQLILYKLRWYQKNLKTRLLQICTSCRINLNFHSTKYPDNSYVIFLAYLLQALWFWLRLAIISLHSIELVCTFTAVWMSILWIFLISHIWSYKHMDHNICHFAYELLITKDPSLQNRVPSPLTSTSVLMLSWQFLPAH